MSSSECCILETTSGQFIRNLRAVERDAPCVPLAASMDWTCRCNLACSHCYVRFPGACNDEMTTAQLKHVLSVMAEGGVLFLVITGGEPLVRRDFEELYLETKSLGLVPTLFTNATLVTPAVADMLAANPPRRVEITIYGHTEETYDAVTGVTGSFRRFRAGVQALLDRGLLVRLKTMVMERNKHEFEAMKAWAEGNGCEFRYDAVIHGRLNGDPSATAGRVSPADVVDLHFAKSTDKTEFQDYQRSIGEGLPPKHNLFECGAGTMTLHVDATGKAHPCMLWRQDPYDLLSKSMDSDWLEHIRKVRDRVPAEGECVTCSDRGLCSYCPPMAIIEAGHQSKPSKYFCDMAAERKRQMRIP